jgi:cytochrome c-type biogenesis protein CcmH/NrfF
LWRRLPEFWAWAGRFISGRPPDFFFFYPTAWWLWCADAVVVVVVVVAVVGRGSRLGEQSQPRKKDNARKRMD